MLRKNQKEWLGSTTKQMEEQRNDLQIKLNKIEDERKKEVEALVKEKKNLSEKIQELEVALREKKGEGLLAHYLEPEGMEESDAQSVHKRDCGEVEELNSKNKKLKKKLQQKDDKAK